MHERARLSSADGSVGDGDGSSRRANNAWAVVPICSSLLFSRFALSPWKETHLGASRVVTSCASSHGAARRLLLLRGSGSGRNTRRGGGCAAAATAAAVGLFCGRAGAAARGGHRARHGFVERALKGKGGNEEQSPLKHALFFETLMGFTKKVSVFHLSFAPRFPSFFSKRLAKRITKYVSFAFAVFHSDRFFCRSPHSHSATVMLRSISMRPSAAVRAAAPRGGATAAPPSRVPFADVVRSPWPLPLPRRPSSSRRSLQPCFAEPANKNSKPQTKEEKDKAIEMKEKLVKGE